MRKIVLCTGGYDPLHSGHISYFESAKKLGDLLAVGVNSDQWLERKKGRPFMNIHERVSIVKSLKMVDHVILFNDSDGSAKNAIKNLRQQYPNDIIVFANGGDRTSSNIPEMDIDDQNVEFAFGVGGEHKMNSSSWILKEWAAPKTVRQWGYYRVLENQENCKVKELVIEPGKSLSMQKHFKRNELWLVSQGQCTVDSITESGYQLPTQFLNKHDSYTIKKGQWHQAKNPYDTECHIIEIQYGEDCKEEDIERKYT